MEPSRYVRLGFGTWSNFLLFVELACHTVMRAPYCNVKLNLLVVDDAVKDIIKGGSKFAGPVQVDSKDRTFYLIYMSTSNSNLTSESMNILIYS